MDSRLFRQRNTQQPPIGLESYPPHELWRLLVDGNQQKNDQGWIRYDHREPGCVESLLDGLALVVKHKDDSAITVDLIKSIHEACTKKINPDYIPGEFNSGKFRNTMMTFGLTLTNASENGLREYLARLQKEKQYGYFFKETETQHHKWFFLGSKIGLATVIKTVSIDANHYINYPNLENIKINLDVSTNEELAHKVFHQWIKDQQVIYQAPSEEIIENRIQEITQNLNDALAKAKSESQSEDELIKLIVQFIQEYDQLHPFQDGNIRTFATLLLPLLCMQCQIEIPTLEDPNVFDFKSIEELCLAVKKGQEITRQLKLGVTKVYDFETSTMPQHLREQFTRMSQPVLDALQENTPKRSP